MKAYQTPSMFFPCVSLSTIFRIKVPSGVDLIRLSEGLSAMESSTDLKWEAHLLKSHPSAISSIGNVPAILSDPCIILGEGDSTALWYLPRALAKPIQVWAMPMLHAEFYLPSQSHIVSGLLPLCEKLQRSITNQSWRTSEQYFRQGGTPSGCLEFSPARHMQGHLVRLVILVSTREFQGSTPGCPGLDPHPYPHDTPTPTPQGGGHSHRCQGADPSGVDSRVWHLPLDHTVQVYNIFIIIYYTR